MVIEIEPNGRNLGSHATQSFQKFQNCQQITKIIKKSKLSENFRTLNFALISETVRDVAKRTKI